MTLVSRSPLPESPAGSPRLPDSHIRLLSLLADMPLASVAELSAHMERSPSSVYRSLWQLSSSGLVSMQCMGATRQSVARWWITPEGMSRVDSMRASWHLEGGRSRLLERLPLVEWFYPVSRALCDSMGRMEEFRWFDGVRWDAAARYERGWAAFVWSGLMQTETMLRDMFLNLGPEMQECTIFGGSAWPGLFCFVAADPWQRETVFRVARSFGVEGNLQVWCVSDDSVAGASEPGASRGWIGQVYSPVFTGNWGWQERLNNSLWCSGRGPRSLRLMDLALEWTGLNADFGRQVLGETGRSLRLQRLIKDLSDGGYLRRDYESGSYRYALSLKGFDVLGRRDRVSYTRSAIDSRVMQMPHERGLFKHEEGVRSMAAQFVSAGINVACGWRSWEHIGGGAGIAPDALVYLNESPYGPGWHYLEYERWARGRVRAGRKLKGYASPRRRDKWPVMFVVWDRDSELIYQSLGRESRIKLLTTTLSRLGIYGAVGGGRCWSVYGQEVDVG